MKTVYYTLLSLISLVCITLSHAQLSERSSLFVGGGFLSSSSGSVVKTPDFSVSIGVLPTEFSLVNLARDFVPFSTMKWDPDPTFDDGFGSFELTINNFADFTGMQVLLWFYNSKDLLPTSEWLVITAPDWLLPQNFSTSPTVAPSLIMVDNMDSSRIVPLIGNARIAPDLDFDPSGQILAFFGETSAIPEPSTIAFFFGLAALGFVVYRRRRA